MFYLIFPVAPDLSSGENYDRVLQLLYDLRNANASTAMPPVVNIVDVSRFRPEPLLEPIIQTSLPDECTDFDLPYASQFSLNTQPLSIVDFPHKSYMSVNM